MIETRGDAFLSFVEPYRDAARGEKHSEGERQLQDALQGEKEERVRLEKELRRKEEELDRAKSSAEASFPFIALSA